MQVGTACSVCSLPVAEMLKGVWSWDEETVLEVKRSQDAGDLCWLPDCPQVSMAKSCPELSFTPFPKAAVWAGEGLRAGMGVHQQGGGLALGDALAAPSSALNASLQPHLHRP